MIRTMSDKKKDGKRDRREVEFDGAVDRARVAEYLAQLSERIASGDFAMENGAESMTLSPGDAMQMKIRARQEGRSQSLKLTIDWEAKVATTDGQDSDLRFVAAGSSPSETGSTKRVTAAKKDGPVAIG